jgi:hypothetical protein
MRVKATSVLIVRNYVTNVRNRPVNYELGASGEDQRSCLDQRLKGNAMNIHDNTSKDVSAVNINTGEDAAIGGDVVGRDKYVVNQFISAESKSGTELLGKFDKLADKDKDRAATGIEKGPKKKRDYRRELLYRLDLKGTRQQTLNILSRWRFVQASPHPPDNGQPVAAVANETLGIGQNTLTTFHSPPIPEILNCSVECELRIIDDGGDPSRWAGVRVRGFRDDIQFGYLVYLRRQGTVELYRAQEVIGGENDFKVRDTKDTWTKVRLDILNSRIAVWVNGKPHIETTDTRFRDKGMVYLHTFGTHAQFRNFSVYRLVKQK